MKSLSILMLIATTACGAIRALSSAEKIEIAETAVAIARCQAVGRACKAADGGSEKCYALYDACMRDAGLRD